MRLLIIPLTGGVGLGPLTRCTAVANEAKNRGHEVQFLCGEYFGRITKKFGYMTQSAVECHPGNNLNIPPFRISDVAIALGWIDEKYFSSAVEREIKVIRCFKPDVIFTETQFSVNVSAQSENIPWVATTSWADHPDFKSPLYTNEDTIKGFERGINNIFDIYAQRRIKDICELSFMRANLKIAPIIPQMQPELKVVPDVNYVGNLLSPEMENDILTNRYDTKIILRKIKQKLEQRKPTIYVYMSPGDIPPKVWISTLIKAFRNTEFNIIVTMAPLKTFTDKIPESENVIFLKSVQSKYVIDNSDIIITHGGANTVTSSLMSGKPMMIFPDMYAERDYNGRAVEKLGAGINFRTEKFTPTDLLDNARKIMSDKKFTSNAKKIGNEMKKLGGSSRTLELIENLQ